MASGKIMLKADYSGRLNKQNLKRNKTAEAKGFCAHTKGGRRCGNNQSQIKLIKSDFHKRGNRTKPGSKTKVRHEKRNAQRKTGGK